jgi:hypothetical protein
MSKLPVPAEGILLTHFIVSGDVERSRRFYPRCWAVRPSAWASPRS